jgi:quinol monooxygenase YgiN
MLKRDEKTIVCVAQFKAKEGKVDELLAGLHGLIPDTRREPGNLRYELHQAIDDPRTITFIEKFADQGAFDQHCAAPYFTAFFENACPQLADSVAVTLYREVLP